jgi:hypothetical protein
VHPNKTDPLMTAIGQQHAVATAGRHFRSTPTSGPYFSRPTVNHVAIMSAAVADQLWRKSRVYVFALGCHPQVSAQLRYAPRQVRSVRLLYQATQSVDDSAAAQPGGIGIYAGVALRNWRSFWGAGRSLRCPSQRRAHRVALQSEIVTGTLGGYHLRINQRRRGIRWRRCK